VRVDGLHCINCSGCFASYNTRRLSLSINLRGFGRNRLWLISIHVKGPHIFHKSRRNHQILGRTVDLLRTAVAQWLRCCATNRKVTGSIPASVSGFFIDIKSFRSHYGPEVDSASNRNEYQEHFLGIKAAGA
jgi:hypothetical protein